MTALQQQVYENRDFNLCKAEPLEQSPPEANWYLWNTYKQHI